MIRNKWVAFVLFTAAFLVFWNALDWVFTALLGGGAYVFDMGHDLALPLVVGLAMGFLFFVRGRD